MFQGHAQLVLHPTGNLPADKLGPNDEEKISLMYKQMPDVHSRLSNCE